MASKKSTAVVNPNLGLFYDRAPLAMNPRMLQDGLNFRVKQGLLSNLNMGWDEFLTVSLNGPVVMIADFVITGGSEKLVFATYTDLYQFVSAGVVHYITPRYETGTVARSGTTVTGSGTTFTTNVKPGDQIHFGSAGIVDPTSSWDIIVSVTDNTHLVTVGSGTISSGNYTVRKLFTGGLENVWQFDTFQNANPSGVNELWMTNGQDAIVRWNGSSTQVENMSSQIGFTAVSLRVYDDMMIFVNVLQSGVSKPTDMLNSDTGKPQNVGSLSSGVSNQFKAHPGTEPILRIEPLGQSIVFYSNESRITLAQFVGSPLFFIFQQVSATVGIVSSNALANFGNYHEFVGPTTQYYFDGSTIKPSNEHVWREILRQQDPSRIGVTFAYIDQQNADVIWSIPASSDIDPNSGATVAYGEHYLEQPGANLPTPYSKRTFPFLSIGVFKRAAGLTWDQITTQWQNTSFRWNDRFFAPGFPLILVGDKNGMIYTLNTNQSANGAAMNTFVKFGRRALFDGRVRGLLTRVYPFVTQFVSPITVTIQMSDSGKGNAMITDTQVFDQNQPEGSHFTVHYRRGRYFELTLASNAVNAPWEVAGYDTDTRPGGMR